MTKFILEASGELEDDIGNSKRYDGVSKLL
jgi:hypothetical protein